MTMMPFDPNGKLAELVAQRFRLLGEPMRLRILHALQAGEQPVNEIVNALGASQPNISKHLQALCQGGLISRTRKGLSIHYRIADPMVFKLCKLVCDSAEEYTRAQLKELSALTPRRARKSAGTRR